MTLLGFNGQRHHRRPIGIRDQLVSPDRKGWKFLLLDHQGQVRFIIGVLDLAERRHDDQRAGSLHQWLGLHLRAEQRRTKQQRQQHFPESRHRFLQ